MCVCMCVSIVSITIHTEHTTSVNEILMKPRIKTNTFSEVDGSVLAALETGYNCHTIRADSLSRLGANHAIEDSVKEYIGNILCVRSTSEVR